MAKDYFQGIYGEEEEIQDNSWDFKSSSLNSSLKTFSSSNHSNMVDNRNRARRELLGVSRTANSILGRDEKQVTVSFPAESPKDSKGTEDEDDSSTPAKMVGRSDLEKRSMILSPDKAVEASHSDGVRQSLMGQALLFTSMTRLLGAKDYRKYKISKDTLAQVLWDAQLLGHGRRSLLGDWPGFEDYCNLFAEHNRAVPMVMELTSTEDDVQAVDLPTECYNYLAFGDHTGEMVEASDEIQEAVFNLQLSTMDSRWPLAVALADLLREEDSEAQAPQQSDQCEEMNGGGEVQGDSDFSSLGTDAQAKFTESYSHPVPVEGAYASPAIEWLDPLTEELLSSSIPADFPESSRLNLAKRKAHKPEPTLSPQQLITQKAQARSMANRLVGGLQFRNADVQRWDLDRRSGELDEGGLHKVAYTDTVFARKEEEDIKKVVVGILVDESGSMHSNGRYDQARQMAMAMYYAMTQIKGITIEIYGHSADDSFKSGGTVQMYDYISKGRQDLDVMAGMNGRGNNADGHAIKAAGIRILQSYPEHDMRILFVLSDGQPHADGYGGEPAVQHIKSVCSMLKNYGLNTYGIAIDKGFGPSFGEATYGPGKYAVLPDVKSAAPLMANFLARITSKL